MSPFPTRLGFGVSGVFGTRLISASQTALMVHNAFKGGLRVFDTAPAYGAGLAERRLGMALQTLPREHIFVMTKAGVSSTGLTQRIRDFSPAGLEASVRASLERMGVEGVDGLTLHGPAPQELTKEVYERLNGLKSAGAFNFLGLAGRGREIDAGLDSGLFRYVMTPVHPFLNDEEQARLDQIAKTRLPILAIETAGDSPAALKFPRRPRDLYNLAKTSRARLAGLAGRGRVPVGLGLVNATRRGGVNCALFTTSNTAHLTDNLIALHTA